MNSFTLAIQQTNWFMIIVSREVFVYILNNKIWYTVWDKDFRYRYRLILSLSNMYNWEFENI